MLTLLLAALLLHLSHLSCWHQPEPHVWFAPLGIGIALLAWFGPRVLLLVAADSILVSLQALLLSGDWDTTLLVMAVLRAGLEAGEVWVAWWCYHRLARGSRSLDDLRSATLFLFLVPGLVVGVFSLQFAALSLWSGDWLGLALLQRWTALWVSQALGVMTLTPFLLSVLTPLLVRRGLVSQDSSGVGDLCVFSERLTWETGSKWPVWLWPRVWLEYCCCARPVAGKWLAGNSGVCPSC